MRDDLKEASKMGSKGDDQKNAKKTPAVMNAGFDHSASGKRFYKVKSMSPSGPGSPVESQ